MNVLGTREYCKWSWLLLSFFCGVLCCLVHLKFAWYCVSQAQRYCVGYIKSFLFVFTLNSNVSWILRCWVFSWLINFTCPECSELNSPSSCYIFGHHSRNIHFWDRGHSCISCSYLSNGMDKGRLICSSHQNIFHIKVITHKSENVMPFGSCKNCIT